jgi:PTS system mannose-specific IIB component
MVGAERSPGSSICWARIDDRLIHGQVVVGWRQHLRYDAIYVVDDKVGEDPFLRHVLCLSAPSGVIVHVYTMAEAVAALSAPTPDRVLLLFKRPQAALALVEGGVRLPHLNVGNLAAEPGSVRVLKSISLTPDHVAALDALAERGVHITFQPTPDDPQVSWRTVRRKRL